MQICGGHAHGIGRERERTLQHVFQLAHIARKRIFLQGAHGVGIQVHARAAGETRQNGDGDLWNVLLHFAQRRHRELNHIQAIEQVLAKFAGVDE